MRVYLIAAPEDEAEAEKLAEYLKRFGVFIRAEYGRMSYPQAHTGEYTLALWSRNAMMSSRQMMLTNRAIDAWENGQLVMARLEHGLNPRGLGDLEMVDLTFPAARQHRYHDVLNALRAMEDDRREALRAQEIAAVEAPVAEARRSQDVDLSAAAPGVSNADLMTSVPEAPREVVVASPAKSASRGFPGLFLGLVLVLALIAGAGYWVLSMPSDDPQAVVEDVSPVEPPPRRALGETQPTPSAEAQLTTVRNEIAALEDQVALERRTLTDMAATDGVNGETLIRQREVIAQLEANLEEKQIIELELSDRFEASAATPPPTEPTVIEQARPLNGPVLWTALGAVVLLAIAALFARRRRRPETAGNAPVAEAQEDTEEGSAPAATPKPAQVLGEGHDAFVSYSHANAETVLPIVQSIEENGITVWIDRDEMRAGQNWAGQIVRAIKSSDRFCLMCSAQAFESDHVRREVYLADKYGKKMVPIRLDATEMPEDIEYFLIGRQWIDLFEVAEEDRLDAIQALLSESEN